MISFNNCFDRLLGGGLLEGVVNHVYGPPASGKTNLALIAAANALGHGKVIYVDPEGGFSVERLRQISGERFEETMDNIVMLQPTTFDEQKMAIGKLEELVSAMKVSLIVVDSIAMLYRMEEDKDVRMLGRMLAQLLRLARKYELPVLLTNQMYSDYETHLIRPMGGQISEYFTKNIIELVRREDGSRYAILRRHVSRPEGESIEFTITDRGIEAATKYSA
jgi:DNA repair protein RadB